jgi:uncharacterized protein (TIGR02145 family)
MKSVGTAYWNSPNTGATNESGFSALPGGTRDFRGEFFAFRDGASFWSASDDDSIYGSKRYRALDYRASDVWDNPNFIFDFYGYKERGLSVRCLRD